MEQIKVGDLAKVSETTPSGSNTNLSERASEIKGLIAISYQAQALPIPDDIRGMAEAYSIALEDIPTERLRACFVRAIRGRRDGFPPASGDVLTEWEGLREELRREADTMRVTVLRLEAGRCPACDGARWVADRRELKRPVLTKCPDCGGTGRGGDAAPY